jgi:hypothetical protein
MPIIDSSGRAVARSRKQSATAPSPDDERLKLLALIANATKADRRQYGHANYVRIAAAITPELTPAQLTWIKSGAFGEVFACAVKRCER